MRKPLTVWLEALQGHVGSRTNRQHVGTLSTQVGSKALPSCQAWLLELSPGRANQPMDALQGMTQTDGRGGGWRPPHGSAKAGSTGVACGGGDDHHDHPQGLHPGQAGH